MIRISSSRVDLRHALPTAAVSALLDSIGTQGFPDTCLYLLNEHFDVDHWALFHHGAQSGVCCVASASRVRSAAAQANVEQFIERCHRVDPSLSAIRREHPEPACIAEMQAEDIRDRQYRHCFELTRVKERVSLFARRGNDLHQLSIYRGWNSAPLSAADIQNFAALAGVVIRSGARHEQLLRPEVAAFAQLDLASIESLLRQMPAKLSRRESEVCARAATGMTIERSADDLRIGKTSIVTYRQRAYAKLGISRQCELLAILSNLRTRAS
jgi:DNA-binding CsgD family transcriptional regulator